MVQKIDALALYAGLDISYPATGSNASLYHAVDLFFTKLEAALSILEPKRRRFNVP